MLDNNELKRANDLKIIEMRFDVWKEMFKTGNINKYDYFEVLKKTMELIKEMA